MSTGFPVIFETNTVRVNMSTDIERVSRHWSPRRTAKRKNQCMETLYLLACFKSQFQILYLHVLTYYEIRENYL